MYLTTCSWERAARDLKVHAWIASCNGNTVIHYYMRISHNVGLPGSERRQTDRKQPNQRAKRNLKQSNSEPSCFDGISSCNISLAGNSSNGSLPCKSTGHVGHVCSIQKGWQLETSINKKNVKYKIKEDIHIYTSTGLFVISIHPTDTHRHVYYIYIHTYTHNHRAIWIHNIQLYAYRYSLIVCSYNVYIYLYIHTRLYHFYQNIIIDMYIYIVIVSINSYILNTSNSSIFHNIQLSVSCMILIFIDI